MNRVISSDRILPFKASRYSLAISPRTPASVSSAILLRGDSTSAFGFWFNDIRPAHWGCEATITQFVTAGECLVLSDGATVISAALTHEVTSLTPLDPVTPLLMVKSIKRRLRPRAHAENSRAFFCGKTRTRQRAGKSSAVNACDP